MKYHIEKMNNILLSAKFSNIYFFKFCNPQIFLIPFLFIIYIFFVLICALCKTWFFKFSLFSWTQYNISCSNLFLQYYVPQFPAANRMPLVSRWLWSKFFLYTSIKNIFSNLIQDLNVNLIGKAQIKTKSVVYSVPPGAFY